MAKNLPWGLNLGPQHPEKRLCHSAIELDEMAKSEWHVAYPPYKMFFLHF